MIGFESLPLPYPFLLVKEIVPLKQPNKGTISFVVSTGLMSQLPLYLYMNLIFSRY
jgi:hypothetical protein